MDLALRPSHFCAVAPVDVASRDDTLLWLCLAEHLAGGFTGPLMRAGRLTGTLFRVRLALLPERTRGGVLALTFTSSGAHELSNLTLVHQALQQFVQDPAMTSGQWAAAASRLGTRLASTDRLPSRSPWCRAPYACAPSDPVRWVTAQSPEARTYLPPLKELERQIAEHRQDMEAEHVDASDREGRPEAPADAPSDQHRVQP
ncbi:hypothetical protein [Streptacidiphilus sp. PAMC 29251]